MRMAVRSMLIGLVGWLFLLAGCSEVEITGRRRLNLVPDSIINSLSVQQYGDFISDNKLSADAEKTAMVKRVGARIQQAVDQFCREHCEKDPFAGYKWEFNLVEDEAVNAFAMPGGKVVVYTGLLPLAQNEAGLATVMGHEIAHIFAKHGSERMTQGLLVQMGGIAVETAMREKPEATRNLFVSSYGLGTQIGLLLPFSRTHENEADKLGLIFMSMAGYDPHEAVAFWKRMSAAKEGKSQPPEFLSTHPTDATRIRNVENLIPEAMEYYQPAQ